MKLYEVNIIKEVGCLDEVFADTLRHAVNNGFKVTDFSRSELENGHAHQVAMLHNGQVSIIISRALNRGADGRLTPNDGSTKISLANGKGVVEIKPEGWESPKSVIDRINGTLKFGGGQPISGTRASRKGRTHKTITKKISIGHMGDGSITNRIFKHQD